MQKSKRALRTMWNGKLLTIARRVATISHTISGCRKHTYSRGSVADAARTAEIEGLKLVSICAQLANPPATMSLEEIADMRRRFEDACAAFSSAEEILRKEVQAVTLTR